MSPGAIIRGIAYVGAVVGASVLIDRNSVTPRAAVDTTVQAVATIVLAAVGIEAVLYNRQLVAAARAEADAAGREATATRAAVEATHAATGESRRQAALASVPYLAAAQPQIIDGADGTRIYSKVENLGPGHALQVALDVEAAYRESPENFTAGTVRSGPIVSVIADGASAVVQIKVSDYRNMSIPYSTTVDDYGHPLPLPEDFFVPIAFRVRLRWQSTLGARAAQTYRWELRDLSQVADTALRDAWAWRFERLGILPAEGLEPLDIVAMDEPET